MSLSDPDRLLIETQELDLHSKPSYESIKSCLIWADELPDGLSMDGRRFILSLLAARSYLHRGIPMVGRLQRLRLEWDNAISSGLRWTGFNRIETSADAMVYLQNSIESERQQGCV